MDVLDVLYLHRFDPDTDMTRDLRDHGRAPPARASSATLASPILPLGRPSKPQGSQPGFDLVITLIQPMYSLVKRQAEVEILPMAQDLGINCAPYSPLGGGLLTGKYASDGSGRLTEDDRYAARYNFAHMHNAGKELPEIAAREGVHPATLAVAWAAAHPSAPMPITSARSAEQLAPSLAAMDYKMTPALYDEIAALVPAPPPATDRAEEA